MTLESESCSTRTPSATPENRTAQPDNRGRKPKPLVEFPEAIMPDWTDVDSFHDAFALHLTRHGDSIGHLHKALACVGAKIDRSTLIQWAAGRKLPSSVRSIAILAKIEERYRLPAGYFKAKLPASPRARSGHDQLRHVLPSERRRLAWHLPDDFDSRPASEREEILQWVRSVIISGTTDYRRYQARTAKHRFAIRFPSLTHGRRMRGPDVRDNYEGRPSDDGDAELAVAQPIASSRLRTLREYCVGQHAKPSSKLDIEAKALRLNRLARRSVGLSPSAVTTWVRSARIRRLNSRVLC